MLSFRRKNKLAKNVADTTFNKYSVIRNVIFKHKGPSGKTKQLNVNLTSNTFQRKYENFD